MTSIGLAREDGVTLHSCASCSRHAWLSGGRELDRTELLATLKAPQAPAARPEQVAMPSRPVEPVEPAAEAAAEPAGPRTVDAAQRAELQELLRAFTVHGSSS